MKIFDHLPALVGIRLRLLFRQRLGWGSFGAMGLLLVVARLAADLSWANPGKIFWDFSLGFSFLLSGFLALFLGSQLYHEERGRRTLHLVLSAGVSRPAWLLANGLAVWIFLLGLNATWILATALLGQGFDGDFFRMALEAQTAAALEMLILVSLALLLSLWVRPLLSFLAGLVITAFLHSLDSLERIFTNEQYGRFVDATGPSIALWISRVLPPLNWFDLRDFVGYEAGTEAWLLVKLGGLAVAWAIVFSALAIHRFERMDL